MSGNKSTLALTEGALAAALSTLFCLMSIYIPVLGTAAFLIIAVPAAIAGYRNGVRWSIMVLAAAAILITLLSSPITGAMVVLTYMPSAIVIALCMRRGKSYFYNFIAGTLAVVVGFCILLALSEIVTGIPVVDYFTDYLQGYYDMTQATYEKMAGTGAISQEQLDEFKTYFDNIIKMVNTLVPAAVIAASAVMHVITMIITVFILRRRDRSVAAIPPFRYFTFPRSVVIAGAAAFLASFLIGKAGWMDTEVLTANIEYIMIFVFAIQGAAAVLYFLNMKKVRRGFQILIMVVLLLTAIGKMVLFYVGIIDICMNRRKAAGGDGNEKK